MPHDLFQVTDHAGRSLGYYSASSKGQAKKAVVAELTARKLSGDEIYRVHQAGYAVTTVEDGRMVASSEPASPEPPIDDQQILPLGNETQASAG